MSEILPQPPVETQRLYRLTGAISREDAFNLAILAVRSMFDDMLSATTIEIPLLDFKPARVIRYAGHDEVITPLTVDAIPAVFRVTEDSATIDSTSGPLGSFGAMGTIELTEPDKWNAQLAEVSVDEFTQHLTHVDIYAKVRPNGQSTFSSYVR